LLSFSSNNPKTRVAVFAARFLPICSALLVCPASSGILERRSICGVSSAPAERTTIFALTLPLFPVRLCIQDAVRFKGSSFTVHWNPAHEYSINIGICVELRALVERWDDVCEQAPTASRPWGTRIGIPSGRKFTGFM